MTEDERQTLHADLTLAFQESEVVKFACHDEDWTCPTDVEVARMVDVVFAVLSEHGLDVVELPGASRTEREAAEFTANYRVTDAAGTLVEPGSVVRDSAGEEHVFEAVATPECVQVSGVTHPAWRFGLTVSPVQRESSLTMADLRRRYDT
jgi:hypothetical protein